MGSRNFKPILLVNLICLSLADKYIEVNHNNIFFRGEKGRANEEKM
jgi:hypothetical protein